MKRKSWIFSFLLAVIVLPCMVLLSACGDKDPNVTGFSVYIGETLVAEDSKTITAQYGDTVNLEDRITVKLTYDDNTTKTITKGTGGYTYVIKDSTQQIVEFSNSLNIGEYDVTISYGDYTGIGVKLVIAKKQLQKPTGTLNTPYTGQSIVFNPSGVLGEYMEIEDNFKTDAGSYNATISLTDTNNYEWADGTITDLTLPWSISKINPTTPTGLTGNIDSSLSEIELPTGWDWDAGDTVLSTSGNYKASFSGTTNYNAMSSVDVYVTAEQTQLSAPSNVYLDPKLDGGYSLIWTDLGDADVTYTIDVDGTPTTGILTTRANITIANIKENHLIKVKAVPTDTNTYIESDWAEITINTNNYNTLTEKLIGLNSKEQLAIAQLMKGGNPNFTSTFLYEANNLNNIRACVEAGLFYFLDNGKMINIENSVASIIDISWSTFQNHQLPLFALDNDIAVRFFNIVPANGVQTVTAQPYTGETKILYCTSTAVSSTLISYNVYYTFSDWADYFEMMQIMVDTSTGNITRIINNAIENSGTFTIGTNYNSFNLYYESNLQKPAGWTEMFNRVEVTVVGGTLTAEYGGNITPTGNVYSVISNDKITLTPTVPEGQEFIKWTFGTSGESTTANYESVINDEVTFTAHFTEVPQETITFTSESGTSLILTPNSTTQGTFTCGEALGTYTISEQVPPSAVATITLTPTEESVVVGTYDRATGIITLQFGGESQTFTRGGSTPSSTALFEGYNIPTNFKGVWSDDWSTHTLIKIGNDFYHSTGIGTYFYEYNDQTNTYTQWYLNNSSWEEEAEPTTISDMEGILSAYFANTTDLTTIKQYTLLSTSFAYETFTNCRRYELRIGGTLAKTIILSGTHDIIIADIVGDVATGTSTLTMTSALDTSKTTFAEYGLTLPNDLLN